MKRAITGIVAASLTLGTMAPAAFAATASTPNYFGSKIAVGTYSSNVQAITAKDAGNTIAMFPFYYIQAGLQSLGYTVKWDGVAKRLDITTPDGITLNTDNLNPGVGDAGIYINGTLVQRAPFSVANDKGGNNKPTAFMATYYLNQALAHVGFNGAYNGTGAGWTLTAPVATAAVTGVSQLNAEQVKVSFSSKVDSTSAGTIGNYYVNGTALTTNDAAAVSDDGKSVVLTLTSTAPSGLQNGTAYAVKVSGVKAASGSTVADFTTSFIANDTTAPSVLSATAAAGTAGTHTVTVKFSEPIHSLGTFYVNGQPATASALSTTDHSANDTVTLTTSQLLTGGQSYSLVAASQADIANNALVSQTVNFTVTSDTTAGAYVSGTATAENVVKLTYNKKVDASSLAGAAITVSKVGGTISSPSLAVDANDPNSVDVTFAPGYTSSVTSVTAYISLSGVKDTNGNTFAAISNVPFTMNQDTTAPVFSSAAVGSDNKSVTLTFSKAIKSVSFTGSTLAGSLTVVNSNGVDVTSTLFTSAGFTGAASVDSNGASATDSKYLKLTSTSSSAITPGTYTVSVPASAFTDTTLAANANKAFTFTFTVGASSNTTAVSIGTPSSVSFNADGSEYFTVALGTQGNATALNPANYSVNGTGLPTGTSIVYTDTNMNTVRVTVPAGTFATDNDVTLAVTNVQNSAGKVMSAPAFVTLHAKDNTAPTVTSAVENLDGTITLNFSEPVSFVSGKAVTLLESDGATPDASTTSAVVASSSKTATVTLTLDGVHVWSDTLSIAAGAFQDASSHHNTSAAITGLAVSQSSMAAGLAASGAVDKSGSITQTGSAGGYTTYNGVDLTSGTSSVVFAVSPDGTVQKLPQDASDADLHFNQSKPTGDYTFYAKQSAGWVKFTIHHVQGQ